MVKQPTDRPVLSVSDLTESIKECLQASFSAVWVAGEISDVARPQSGHVYMTLKDNQAQIRAIMWRSAAQRLKFPIEDGMEVLCQGEIDIYPPRGNYQLIVRTMELRGEGAAQRALRKLQESLAKEGLFDRAHKKPLPKFPQRVAVITSPTGAAIHDFLEVARRRWHGTEMLVLPVRVQGAGSVNEIVRALRFTNKLALQFDAIVLTRGGGSMEDLWSFNDEKVVRAIHASNIPVVSAVGHEIDVTLADLVADVRALTPSEAAERVLPSTNEVQKVLQHWSGRMLSLLRGNYARARMRLEAAANSRALRRPDENLRVLSRRLDEFDMRMRRGLTHRLDRSRNTLVQAARQLESLSPLAVLGRGYSITQHGRDDLVLRAADAVTIGDTVRTRLAEGEIISRVEKTKTGKKTK